MMDNKNIGKKLIELRNSKNLTQKELGQIIGVSTASIAMYEIGERIPRDEVKVRISKYFGVPVQAIFY